MCLTWLMDRMHTMCFGIKCKLQRAVSVSVSPEIHVNFMNNCVHSSAVTHSANRTESACEVALKWIRHIWGGVGVWGLDVNTVLQESSVQREMFKKKKVWVTPFISRWEIKLSTWGQSLREEAVGTEDDKGRALKAELSVADQGVSAAAAGVSAPHPAS